MQDSIFRPFICILGKLPLLILSCSRDNPAFLQLDHWPNYFALNNSLIINVQFLKNSHILKVLLFQLITHDQTKFWTRELQKYTICEKSQLLIFCPENDILVYLCCLQFKSINLFKNYLFSLLTMWKTTITHLITNGM